jgi:hypothetical protein
MFRFRDTSTLLDPEKLAVHKGDTVLYGNEKYLVIEAGMRWLRCEKLSEPGTPYSIKKSEVVKLHPEAQGDGGTQTSNTG